MVESARSTNRPTANDARNKLHFQRESSDKPEFRPSFVSSSLCFSVFLACFLHLMHMIMHIQPRTLKKATSLLLPALCCLSVFLSHLSSLKQRNRFQFHVFSFHSSICLFLHPPLSILISGNQSAVNNLLNSIDRHHLVSWPAT